MKFTGKSAAEWQAMDLKLDKEGVCGQERVGDWESKKVHSWPPGQGQITLLIQKN